MICRLIHLAETMSGRNENLFFFWGGGGIEIGKLSPPNITKVNESTIGMNQSVCLTNHTTLTAKDKN